MGCRLWTSLLRAGVGDRYRGSRMVGGRQFDSQRRFGGWWLVVGGLVALLCLPAWLSIFWSLEQPRLAGLLRVRVLDWCIFKSQTAGFLDFCCSQQQQPMETNGQHHASLRLGPMDTTRLSPKPPRSSKQGQSDSSADPVLHLSMPLIGLQPTPVRDSGAARVQCRACRRSGASRPPKRRGAVSQK